MIAEFQPEPGLRPRHRRGPVRDQGKDALGSLMTDAMRQAHGLDIAFQNNGGIRLGRLPKKITLKDVYTLDPFGNQVVEIAMTPAEIRALVATPSRSGGEIDLQVSGITYVVRTDAAQKDPGDPAAPPGRRPPARGRTYKVGVSSYVASSYNFAHKDPGRSLQTTTADALILFLESGARPRRLPRHPARLPGPAATPRRY